MRHPRNGVALLLILGGLVAVDFACNGRVAPAPSPEAPRNQGTTAPTTTFAEPLPSAQASPGAATGASVRVLSTTGIPVVGASVRLVDVLGGATTPASTTDMSGTAVFSPSALEGFQPFSPGDQLWGRMVIRTPYGEIVENGSAAGTRSRGPARRL